MIDPIATLIRRGDAKVIRRGVVPEKYQWGGIQLGTGLEIELESGQVIRWKQRPILFWNDVGKYLGLAEGWGRHTSRGPTYFDMPGLPQKVPQLYRAFNGREAKATKSWMSQSMPNRWVSVGAVARLDYHSDKNGRRASYTHDHGNGVKLYRFGGPSRAVWVVKGGSLNVTGRGIVN